MAAMVFVGSMISIPTGASRIHLGNSMILLSGFLLGGEAGGLAGGLGSLLYDALIYGANPVGCLVTFVSKGIMGYAAGCIAKKSGMTKGKTLKLILAGTCGEIAYIVIYLTRQYITYHYVNGTTEKAALAAVAGALGASLFNAAAAIVISCILYGALSPVLHRAGISYDSE